MIEIWPEEHPNKVEWLLIDPMFAALGACISGEGINAVEDWWLDKIKYDITFQRFKIHGAHAAEYENQYMVKHYADNVHARLPSLTGTVDEYYENFRPYPDCEFKHWWGVQVRENIGMEGNVENSFWRSLRNPDEIEMNKHPNRSQKWVPQRLRDIRAHRKFYFSKPNWKEEVEIETPLPNDHIGGVFPFEYLSPFSFAYKVWDETRNYGGRTKGDFQPYLRSSHFLGKQPEKKFEETKWFDIKLRNPTTNKILPPLFSQEMRDKRANTSGDRIQQVKLDEGYEKIDLKADAYVQIISDLEIKGTSSSNPHDKKNRAQYGLTNWFIRVTKPFMNMAERVNEDEFGVVQCLQMDFGVADIQALLTGEEEGGRLIPYSIQYVHGLPPSTNSTTLGVNYYAPTQSRLGLLNWITF